MAESPLLKGTLATLQRQGLFSGDIGHAQQLGLIWLMTNETKEAFELEKYRTINIGLVTNPATSAEFLKVLTQDMATEEVAKSDPDWFTPESVQDIERFLQTNVL